VRERVERRLSFVLRHAPESVGVALDRAGWVGVDDLLRALATHGLPLSRQDLQRVVERSGKQRFELDGNRVRARQGHTVPVNLDLPTTVPPPVLFHGTPPRNVASILAGGLDRGRRHHVHLSSDARTAAEVGARRSGQVAVLVVDAAAAAADGLAFWVTGNGVWLVGHVPARYLSPAGPHIYRP